MCLSDCGVQVVHAVKSGNYPFVMCNFAPPDMVGHTGVYEAAVVACSATGETHTSMLLFTCFVAVMFTYM